MRVVRTPGCPGAARYDGESNWLADRHEVVAMNQPHMAPWWFPSNDHPRDKALMDISHHRAVGQARSSPTASPVGRERARRPVATHHWRADEPMAPYLAMFAAGPFHVERQPAHGDAAGTAAVSKRLGDDALPRRA